jgi:hypothetical protein
MPIITAIEIEEQGCVGQGGLDGYREDRNDETRDSDIRLTIRNYV